MPAGPKIQFGLPRDYQLYNYLEQFPAKLYLKISTQKKNKQKFISLKLGQLFFNYLL